MQVTKPQKAENADLVKLQFPALALPKIDGVRGLFITSQFTGRTLKAFKNQNITDAYSHPALAGFDGELCHGSIYNPNQDLCRNTTGLVNSLRYNTAGEIPNLYVFDYLTRETADLPYADRWILANRMVDQLTEDGQFSYLRKIPHTALVNSLEEVETIHAEYLASGFEGTVLRKLTAPHKNGRCTVNEGNYMRIKDFTSEEGVVIDFSEAQANLNPVIINALGHTERSTSKVGKTGNGMVGSIVVERNSGELVVLGPGRLSHEERIDFWENPQKLLGKTVTFKYMPYGSFNKPRFAMFENFRATEDM
jgi:DNA ligase-1